MTPDPSESMSETLQFAISAFEPEKALPVIFSTVWLRTSSHLGPCVTSLVLPPVT